MKERDHKSIISPAFGSLSLLTEPRSLDRREFLKASGAIGITVAGRALGALGDIHRVTIIGAGIVGASIGYYLSREGCEVTLLDKTGVATQASGNSFAWLNASWYDAPESYFELRKHSLREYRLLSTELEFPIRWGGSLEWYHTDGEMQDIRDGIRRLTAQHESVSMINAAAVSRLEPALSPDTDEFAWSWADGAVDPAATTHALVDGTIENGGTLVAPAEVTSIDFDSKRARVVSTGGEFESDLVVVAAGANANEIARMIDLGTDLVVPATPGIIVTTQPIGPLLNTVCYTSDSHFHQLPDGRVVIGEKTGAPQTEQHLAYVAGRPNAYPNTELAVQHARRVMETAAKYVAALDDTDVGRIGVGWRPLPLDGLPVIGHVPGNPRVFLASMHSGITLAPIVGLLASMEILGNGTSELLHDFRVERFL